MPRPQRVHVYRNAVSDSLRWDAFTVRPGDVIVATAPKCGTTWTQKLCAMLVEGSPILPRPLAAHSPWLEQIGPLLYPMIAELDARPGRRVLKTHVPLDGLPFHEAARYVICGRDPRDAFLSMMDHLANTSPASWAETDRRMGRPPGPPPPTPDPNAVFPRWASEGQYEWQLDGAQFQSVFSAMETWWRHRDLPNLHFLHYRDLSQDLAGEARRLADFLGVTIDEALWPSILEAGGFEAMQADADRNAPGDDAGRWRSNRDFFRAARIDQWRKVLSPENQALYETLSRARFDPALKAWLERGRAAL